MEELLSLAEQSGMSREKGQAVAGGLFAILQEQMDPNQYQQMRSQIPEMEYLAQQHREENGSTDRSLGSSILGMITKQNSQGSNGGMDYLINTLKKHKVTAAELIILIPLVLWFLKRQYGVDIFHLFGGGGGGSSSTNANSSINSNANKPNNGMFGFGGNTNSNNATTGKSTVPTGSPTSSFSGTPAYYNQLFAGGSDGRGSATASGSVVVPSYPVPSQNSNPPFVPSYPVPNANNQYSPYGSNNGAYAPAYPVPPSNNQYNPNQGGGGVYVPNYSSVPNGGNNGTPYNQYQNDGRVFVPNYSGSQNSQNPPYNPANGGYGYNNQY